MIHDGRPRPVRGFPVLIEGNRGHIVWTLDPGALTDRSLRVYADGPPWYLERLRTEHPTDYERSVLARAELRRRAHMEAA